MRSLCLSGPSHLGKATFLKETLSGFVTETDLFIGETSIDSAREAVEFCKTHPLSSPNRYVIIDDAHLLTEAAQDAYLKILEDPGTHACVIFVVPDEGFLQPAIHSRFRSFIRFRPLGLTDIRAFAVACGAGDESRAIMLCGGRPGLFSAMFGEDGGSKHVELYDILIRAYDGKASLLLDSTPSVVKEAKDPIKRECVAHICREAALAVLKTKNVSYDQITRLLRYSSLLISTPAANAEIHWYRIFVS